jgi:catechol 2,3-dioxygenase-like lactoylglutathione lyase family enzyme
MASDAIRFQGFNVVVADQTASMRFYEALGLDVVDKHGQGRVCVDAPNQHFDLDTAPSVPQWNAGWRPGSSIGITFEVATREAVDELAGRLAAEGYVVQQPAVDAPWGRRLAVIEDPDGNSVALMSAE